MVIKQPPLPVLLRGSPDPLPALLCALEADPADCAPQLPSHLSSVGPWQEPRGQKERDVSIFHGSCASPPWWFPSLSSKPPVPRSPPSTPSGGVVASHCCWPREPQLQPTSVNGGVIECSPSTPSGVNSVFCWHPYGYTECSCYYGCSFRLEFPFLRMNSQPPTLISSLGHK